MKGVVSVILLPCDSKASGSSDPSSPCASEMFIFFLCDAILKLVSSPVVEARLGLSDGEFCRLVLVDPAIVDPELEDSSLFFAWKAMTTAAESAMPDAR